MATFARTWDEVRQNLLTLENYRLSSNPELVEFYQDRVRRGTCFVAYASRGQTLFGPSRFIGYANNSQQMHENNKDKDGRETNPEIERILNDKFLPRPELESRFQEFCREYNILPDKKVRKYIRVGFSKLTEADLIYDLEQINSDPTVLETERQQLSWARVGQGQFRTQLLGIWRKCPVTGCEIHDLLRASHIKPWRACSNVERLDPFNGLLLAPNLDCAFDLGLITFSRNGELIVSSVLTSADAQRLGIVAGSRIVLNEKHQLYLEYHRTKVFQRRRGGP